MLSPPPFSPASASHQCFGVVSVQQTTLICALGQLPGAAGTEVNPSATWVEMTQPRGTALIEGQNRNIVGAELPDEVLAQLRWRETVSWATGAATLYPEGVWQHQGHHCECEDIHSHPQQTASSVGVIAGGVLSGMAIRHARESIDKR